MRPVLPKSFEARGTLVPFENVKLRRLWLRAAEGQRSKDWEAVFENYTGSAERQNLVMQWVQLPNWTRFSDRDRALFDQINAQFPGKAVEPLRLRQVVLATDRDFSGSQAASVAARVALDAARRDRFTVYISLLAQATRECGVARGDVFMAKANSVVLMQAIRSAPGEGGASGAILTNKVFGYLSTQAKLPLGDVVARIEAVSDLLAPIGAINLEADPTAKQEGHLSLALVRLDRFRESVQAHEKESNGDAANRALIVHFSASQFKDFILEKMSSIEQKLSYFVAVIRDNKAVCEEIGRWIGEIAYALDGWSDLIDVWDEARDAYAENPDNIVFDLAIEHILLYLPTLPESATNQENRRVWNGINLQRTKMVKQLTNWIDGKTDKDLQARILSARADQRAGPWGSSGAGARARHS